MHLDSRGLIARGLEGADEIEVDGHVPRSGESLHS